MMGSSELSTAPALDACDFGPYRPPSTSGGDMPGDHTSFMAGPVDAINTFGVLAGRFA
jgi:hypothetical protein